MKKELQEKFGLVGVVIGACLMIAHAIHLPMVLLGTLGFGGSSMMNSWALQMVGAILTIISIVLLVKNKSMKTKIVAGIIIAIGVIVLAGFGWSQMKTSMHQGGSNSMADFPCHQMGGQWMGDCTFDENGNPILDTNEGLSVSGEKFSEEVDGLEDVLPTEVITLKDGDVYEMTAGLVKQEVGNRMIKRLAYNRMIPGPIITAEKGSSITLRFTNELDVETTLHSHGLRGEDKFDGVPKEMGGKQVAMKPGDTFNYTLEFNDTGVFWYHPHIREDYGQELGLYGNFHITEDGYWNEVNKEEFLVVDDFQLGTGFLKDTTTQTLMGRFGEILLVNNSEDYNLKVKKNETIRFFMTNVANTRTFDVSIPGIQTKLVGGDVGRIEKESYVESMIIAPSERWIFEAKFEQPGTYNIEHRGTIIGTITVSSEQIDKNISPAPLRSNTPDYAVLRNNMANLLEKKPDKRLTIDIEMPGMAGMMRGGMMMDDEHGSEAPHGDEGIEWEDEMRMMNLRTDEDSVTWVLRDADTNKENMEIDWEFTRNDFVKIEIYNDPASMHPMQHPIHFHGQRFAVISRNGNAVDNLQWEDTTLIRTGEKIEIILNTTNVGTWMSHCHIAEHLGAGMMFNFTVE